MFWIPVNGENSKTFFIASGKNGIGIICPMSISEADKNTIWSPLGETVKKQSTYIRQVKAAAVQSPNIIDAINTKKVKKSGIIKR